MFSCQAPPGMFGPNSVQSPCPRLADAHGIAPNTWPFFMGNVMISQWISGYWVFRQRQNQEEKLSVSHRLRPYKYRCSFGRTKFDLLFLTNPFCAQHFKAWMWARTKVRRASLKHRRAPMIAEIPPNGYHNLEPYWPYSYRNEGISRKFSMCSPLFEAFQHRSTGSGEICFFLSQQCAATVPSTWQAGMSNVEKLFQSAGPGFSHGTTLKTKLRVFENDQNFQVVLRWHDLFKRRPAAWCTYMYVYIYMYIYIYVYIYMYIYICIYI